MARRPVMRVTGVRELRRAMARAQIDVADLKAANAKVASMVAALAGPRTPSRTGRLRSTVRGNRAVGRAVVTAGSGLVKYAGPIHWGWPARHITAQPWISDAAVSSEAQWLNVYSDALTAIVNQVERSTP